MLNFNIRAYLGKCWRAVHKLLSNHLCLTLREMFISLLCLVIILLGVGHVLTEHHIIPRTFYRDTNLEKTIELVANSTQRGKDDGNLAALLYKEIRILCIIMTSEETLWTKAVHVNATWAKRCNSVFFMTDDADERFPQTVGINPNKSKHFLAQKVFESLDYIYEKHFKEADWFMKCDDDTYVIMENLRHFLLDKNPNEAVFYGQRFRNTKRVNYFTGGAGYLISKMALKIFNSRDPDICKNSWDGANKDVRISECMTNLGVTMGDTLDTHRKTRFHAFPPWTHLQGNFPTWYKFRSVLGVQKGVNSLSPYAISFHKFESADYLYMLEYFVYILRPYGIQFGLHPSDYPDVTRTPGESKTMPHKTGISVKQHK